MDFEHQSPAEDELFTEQAIVEQTLAFLQQNIEDAAARVSATWTRKGYEQVGPLNFVSPYRNHSGDETIQLSVFLSVPSWMFNSPQMDSLIKEVHAELDNRDESRKEAKKAENAVRIAELQAEIDRLSAED